MVIGVLHERGVHFHLALEHRLEPGIHGVPGRNLRMPRRQHGVGADHAQFLLPIERDLALFVPAVGELALVLVDPFLGDVMRRVGGTRREVHEERLVRQQGFLLARPRDRLVGQVFGEVVALFRRLRRLDGRRPLIEGRVPLVVLAADEAVEVLESTAAGRPRVERPGRARLPDRHLVALAELRRRIAVQLEGQRQRRLGVGQHRAVAGRGGRDFRDAAHADRVVIAAGEQRLPRRRAQRGRVEARVSQPALGQLLEVRGLAGTAEHAGRAVAHVVDEDHQHIGRTLRRPHVPDRRELRVRILRVIRDQTVVLDVGNRQVRSVDVVGVAHAAAPWGRESRRRSRGAEAARAASWIWRTIIPGGWRSARGSPRRRARRPTRLAGAFLYVRLHLRRERPSHGMTDGNGSRLRSRHAVIARRTCAGASANALAKPGALASSCRDLHRARGGFSLASTRLSWSAGSESWTRAIDESSASPAGSEKRRCRSCSWPAARRDRSSSISPICCRRMLRGSRRCSACRPAARRSLACPGTSSCSSRRRRDPQARPRRQAVRDRRSGLTIGECGRGRPRARRRPHSRRRTRARSPTPPRQDWDSPLRHTDTRPESPPAVLAPEARRDGDARHMPPSGSSLTAHPYEVLGRLTGRGQKWRRQATGARVER